MGFTRKLVRVFALRAHRSKVPTRLMPLSEIRSAVVYVNAVEPYCEPFKLKLKEFFNKRGIELKIIGEFDKDLRTDSDFFLSLNPKPCINERYAASSSTARFKAGRHQLKGGVYDLVVSDTTPEPVAMKEAFEVIEKMLNNIK